MKQSVLKEEVLDNSVENVIENLTKAVCLAHPGPVVQPSLDLLGQTLAHPPKP